MKLKDDFKIYWGKFPIAKLAPGKDYLNPEINLIIDDMIENNDQKNLSSHLKIGLIKKLNEEILKV